MNTKFFNHHGGPLHYFGNRSLCLPCCNGKMKLDTSWLKQAIGIVLSNSKGKKFKKCFEPFAGSAAWSLAAMEHGLGEEYIINDCNKVLIDFFITIKENPSSLKDAYADLVTSFNQTNDKDSFFKTTIERYNIGNDAQKILFISFLINYSWGGMIFHDKTGNIIYREPLVNGKAVPGFLDTATLSVKEYFSEIDRVSKLFNENTVHFLCGDFEQALHNLQEGDFVNLNPPYPENDRSIAEQYGLYFEIYSREDLHKNICNVVQKMDALKITYFMCYGLHNLEMQQFVILNSSNKYRHHLRVIGFDNCIFGKLLDQWYFSEDIIVPDIYSLDVIHARTILQDRKISHSEALELFAKFSSI